MNFSERGFDSSGFVDWNVDPFFGGTMTLGISEFIFHCIRK